MRRLDGENWEQASVSQAQQTLLNVLVEVADKSDPSAVGEEGTLAAALARLGRSTGGGGRSTAAAREKLVEDGVAVGGKIRTSEGKKISLAIYLSI